MEKTFQSPIKTKKKKKSKHKDIQPKIDLNKTLLFDKHTLKELAEQQFEYTHIKGSSGFDESIFKNMEVLMKERSALSHEYIEQSDFFEIIRDSIRGNANPAEMLM